MINTLIKRNIPFYFCSHKGKNEIRFFFALNISAQPYVLYALTKLSNRQIQNNRNFLHRCTLTMTCDRFSHSKININYSILYRRLAYTIYYPPS